MAPSPSDRPSPSLRTRLQMEEMERLALAPHAQLAAESAGRFHPEPDHPYRMVFQRDRARVIHSRAFRRLEYKTQVFLDKGGDHVRTRLTHTIEVASISRTIACALGCNDDLAEVVALAHDLGHAPLGHCGEETLNQLMEGHGGFEHNLQSLRIVEKLEIKYPEFDGLNLSYEVLEGLRKHEQGYERWAHGVKPRQTFSQPSLEAQIANLADEITYYSHDLDDGLDHGLIRPEQLDDLAVWNQCADRVRDQFPDLANSPRKFITYVIRSLIDFQVANVVQETCRRIGETGVAHADEVRAQPDSVAGYSADLAEANAELRRFLYENVYLHPAVAAVNAKGCVMIEALFEALRRDPGQLEAYRASHGTDEDLERTICDYISGMTDRFLAEEYHRLVRPGI